MTDQNPIDDAPVDETDYRRYAPPSSITPTPSYPQPPSSIESFVAEPEKRSGNGCLWGVGGALGCLVLLLIPIILALVMGTTTLNSLVANITGIFQPVPPRAQVNSTQTLVNSIQPLGQLVSVSTQLAKADILVSIQQGTLNACGFTANHVAQGAVEAGIDLTQIDADNVTYDAATETYTVVIPAPQLTSCRIDQIRQYDRSFTTCNIDWDEARVLANYSALTDFRNDAVEGGILNRAESEARLVLSSFISALTGQRVVIVFEQSDQNVMPSSCTPSPPDGWSFDTALNAWTR